MIKFNPKQLGFEISKKKNIKIAMGLGYSLNSNDKLISIGIRGLHSIFYAEFNDCEGTLNSKEIFNGLIYSDVKSAIETDISAFPGKYVHTSISMKSDTNYISSHLQSYLNTEYRLHCQELFEDSYFETQPLKPFNDFKIDMVVSGDPEEFEIIKSFINKSMKCSHPYMNKLPNVEIKFIHIKDLLNKYNIRTDIDKVDYITQDDPDLLKNYMTLFPYYKIKMNGDFFNTLMDGTVLYECYNHLMFTRELNKDICVKKEETNK